MIGLRIFCVAIMTCGVAAVAQQPTLALNTSRPYVFVQFDHSGPRQPSTLGESHRGIWLKLVNNSTIPIAVRTFDLGTGDKAAGIMFEVARVSRRIRHGHKLSTQPHGYNFDVATHEVIEPGKSMIFSVPAECISEDWYIRVPFEFELPPVKEGYQPTAYADFSASNLPVSHASAQPNQGHPD
jgi:hypothetical protein